MIESQYTRNVHERLDKDQVFAWKIADTYAGGVPDAFYRGLASDNGRVLWIEYKYLQKLPKKDSTLIIPKLTLQQHSWLQNALLAGELAWVIVGYGSQGVVYSAEEWQKGISCMDFKARLDSYQDIASRISLVLNSETIEHALM